MVKDRYLKIIAIPLLGIALPFFCRMIPFRGISMAEKIIGIVFFIILFYCCWMGARWIHGRLRIQFNPQAVPLARLSILCITTGLFGFALGFGGSLAWYFISRENFSGTSVLIFSFGIAACMVMITMVYEILFLSKERELDSRIVKQLDRERSDAEMSALSNELDPHFIFNSLNTLNHLIISSPHQAYLFNNKFAQVYKYYLVNKSNALISLRDEMEFIENYFFLLQIRHENKLQLKTAIESPDHILMIPTFALQILLENAIKHNEFSSEQPLEINIFLNGQYLKVSNNVKPKPYMVSSTGIGLKNLSARYKLLCNKDIVVELQNNDFVVKLPLIKTL
jgi:sensor histidine kinase YesM